MTPSRSFISQPRTYEELMKTPAPPSPKKMERDRFFLNWFSAMAVRAHEQGIEIGGLTEFELGLLEAGQI